MNTLTPRTYLLRHLVNEGVEETPPSPPDTSSLVDEDDNAAAVAAVAEKWTTTASADGTRDDDVIFTDLVGANVGFQHWHPVPVTARGDRLAGQSEMGGVWEWTSSTLRKHEGFEPMSLYPLYTGKKSAKLFPLPFFFSFSPSFRPSIWNSSTTLF